MNTHTIVADIHQSMFKTHENVDSKNQVVGGTLLSSFTE